MIHLMTDAVALVDGGSSPSPTLVPDWVCEILSPTTRRRDLIHKLPYYARIGVMRAQKLLVDADQPGWAIIGTYSEETEARIAPFDAVPLDIASWWPPAGSIEGDDDEP